MVLYSPAPISVHMERLELPLFGTPSLKECGTKAIYARASALSLG